MAGATASSDSTSALATTVDKRQHTASSVVQSSNEQAGERDSNHVCRMEPDERLFIPSLGPSAIMTDVPEWLAGRHKAPCQPGCGCTAGTVDHRTRTSTRDGTSFEEQSIPLCWVREPEPTL